MNNLDKLDNELKAAKKVVWPATQNDCVNKLVFQLAEHVKQLYIELEEFKSRVVEPPKEYIPAKEFKDEKEVSQANSEDAKRRPEGEEKGNKGKGKIQRAKRKSKE